MHFRLDPVGEVSACQLDRQAPGGAFYAPTTFTTNLQRDAGGRGRGGGLCRFECLRYGSSHRFKRLDGWIIGGYGIIHNCRIDTLSTCLLCNLGETLAIEAVLVDGAAQSVPTGPTYAVCRPDGANQIRADDVYDGDGH